MRALESDYKAKKEELGRHVLKADETILVNLVEILKEFREKEEQNKLKQ